MQCEVVKRMQVKVYLCTSTDCKCCIGMYAIIELINMSIDLRGDQLFALGKNRKIIIAQAYERYQ